jgi:VIT1/CCC1 family predicted Fe2+/Mn2+ transporter
LPARACDDVLVHAEDHRQESSGWLRAAVLGANDGLLSTASLVVGMASAGADAHALLIASTAALVAGALSMAAGEYVSVSSQADLERADLARERAELARDPHHERRELASIYVARGLSPALAAQVAEQLMRHDALAAHARDELGHTEGSAARPVQAALSSAAAFAAGGLMPLLLAQLVPATSVSRWVTAASLLLLAALGALGARAGRARPGRAAARVLVLGALAMLLSAALGRVVG